LSVHLVYLPFLTWSLSSAHEIAVPFELYKWDMIANPRVYKYYVTMCQFDSESTDVVKGVERELGRQTAASQGPKTSEWRNCLTRILASRAMTLMSKASKRSRIEAEKRFGSCIGAEFWSRPTIWKQPKRVEVNFDPPMDRDVISLSCRRHSPRRPCRRWSCCRRATRKIRRWLSSFFPHRRQAR
jgi:hypothetical protein